MSNDPATTDSLGQLFITGIQGLELSKECEEFLRSSSLGGVILFAHNYDSPAQVAELISQIQACRKEIPLWIAVDQEGGRVQRFKKGFTRLPDALAIGELDSPKFAFEVGKMMAAELRAVGVNLNFAPVADIFTNPKNPVIGNRAYGRTEERVTQTISGIVRGHLLEGVQPCVKHFPGHGDTSVDSHFELPKVERDLDGLKQRELIPFIRAFRSRCAMVMTAHILNPLLDPKFPATLSHATVTGLLREELRYRGVVITDDLQMQAITDHYGASEVPLLALDAGCDILLYRTVEAARIGFKSVQDALQSGRLSRKRLEQSITRILDLKKKVVVPYRQVDMTKISQCVGIPAHSELLAPALSKH